MQINKSEIEIFTSKDGKTEIQVKLEGETVWLNQVPLIGNVYNLIDDGCIPGASFRNLDYVEEHLIPDLDLDYNLKMIAFDAQTSGGLMMSVSSNIVEEVLLDLHSAGLTTSAIIGEVTELREKYISLVN